MLILLTVLGTSERTEAAPACVATSQNSGSLVLGSETHVLRDVSLACQKATDGAPPQKGTKGPNFSATYPVLVVDPAGGSFCIQVHRHYFATQREATEFQIKQDTLWILYMIDYATCPSLGPVPGVPAVAASDFWHDIGEDWLPTPKPHIAPGYMLAGKRAYLETNAPTTAHFDHETPLGMLVIDATSKVWVDWGDAGGHFEGPKDGPGAPWPDGKITHFWTDLGRYDIRVQQRWTATWTLAGEHGQLTGLSTEGRIDDFEVKELQAIINH
ncbi:MAG TPA: hypothetical protein VFJ85_18595 [Acidimicrobiales bacterium]|nr:hypothetical protein [Acidimicrobiales bacterium]